MGVPPMPATARLTPKLGRFRTHPEWGSQSLVGRLRIHSCPADTNGEKTPVLLEKPVRPEGFEPPTLGSEDRCSIQLSYGRISISVTSVA